MVTKIRFANNTTEIITESKNLKHVIQAGGADAQTFLKSQNESEATSKGHNSDFENEADKKSGTNIFSTPSRLY